MIISKGALLYQLDYSTWATQVLLDVCSELNSDEFNRDLHASHSSIAGLMRHIFYAERVCLKRLRANSLPPLAQIGDQSLFADPDPQPVIAQLKEKWPEIWSGLHEYLDNASDQNINSNISGPDCAIPRWKLLLHAMNHSTLHRGQVITLLRQLGKQPPNLDLFSFYLTKG